MENDIIVNKPDGIVAKITLIAKKYWIAILIVLILIVMITFFSSGMFKISGFKPYQPRTDPQSDFDLKSELTRLTKRQEETLRRLKFSGVV